MGCVFDIQRFCLHDGSGLRTTVFLKGCPLRCRWCSNPESQRLGPELLYNRSRCMGCLSCVPACPKGLIAAVDGGVHIDRNGCDACGACEAVCPMAALVRKGRVMSAAEVVREVVRDREFYERSAGGVTVSGGEPFLQADFLNDLLLAIKDAGVSTAVETTAHADWRDMERCLPLLDCVLVDVKHADSASHAAWTGVELATILSNVRRLCEIHPDVRIRIPVIPGFNSDETSLGQLATLVEELGRGVELLSYHVLGEGKYGMLNRRYPGAVIPASDAAEATKRALAFFFGRGIRVTADV